MKKVLWVITIILIFGLSFTGCSQSEPSETTTSPSKTTSTISTTTQATDSEPIVLSLGEYLPSTHWRAVAAQEWADKIEAATNGRVKINTYMAGTLVGPDQAWVEVKNGTCDIYEIPGQYQPSIFPITIATQRFFYGVKNIETVYSVYDQLTKDFPEFAAEWSDVKVLFCCPGGIQSLHTSKPVRTLEDLKGMNIRTTGSWLKETFSILGASTVAIPPTDLYTSLQKGIADGHVHPMEAIESLRTAEILPYTTNLGLCDGAPSRFCINWDTWNNLPDDIQKILGDGFEEWSNMDREALRKSYDNAIEFAEQYDHEWINLSEEDQAKFNQALEQEALIAAKELDDQGLPGSEILARVQELIKSIEPD